MEAADASFDFATACTEPLTLSFPSSSMNLQTQHGNTSGLDCSPNSNEEDGVIFAGVVT